MAKCLCKKCRLNPAALERAIEQYKKFHWGDPGNGRVSPMLAANPDYEPVAKCGLLTVIGYLTQKKGDREPVEYIHHFSNPLPTLAYNSGGLVILNGGYWVEARGIVR